MTTDTDRIEEPRRLLDRLELAKHARSDPELRLEAHSRCICVMLRGLHRKATLRPRRSGDSWPCGAKMPHSTRTASLPLSTSRPCARARSGSPRVPRARSRHTTTARGGPDLASPEHDFPAAGFLERFGAGVAVQHRHPLGLSALLTAQQGHAGRVGRARVPRKGENPAEDRIRHTPAPGSALRRNSP